MATLEIDACALFAVALVAGCAHRPPPAPREAHVQMDPIVFVAHPSGVELVDPAALFDEAAARYRDKRFTESAALYDRVAGEFPDSRFVTPALYDAGLALEGAGDLKGAADRYRRLIARGAEIVCGKPVACGDLLDAHFRLGRVDAQAGDFTAAAADYAAILAEPAGLTLSDRLEAMARLSEAQLESGELASAEKSAQESLALFHRHQTEERLDTDYFVGMAAFELGEVSHARFRALPVRLPEKQLAADLEAKAQLLLVAQGRYLDAMRVENPDWATAAGYQIATLYRELYDALVGAPVPPALTGEARDVYLEEVKKQVRPLLQKAMRVHERNTLMAERIGVDNEWVRRSNEEMERLRRLLVPGAAPDAAPPPPAPPPPAPLPRPRDDVPLHPVL